MALDLESRFAGIEGHLQPGSPASIVPPEVTTEKWAYGDVLDPTLLERYEVLDEFIPMPFSCYSD